MSRCHLIRRPALPLGGCLVDPDEARAPALLGAATDALDHTGSTRKDGAAVAAQTIDLISSGSNGTLNIHLADDETRAVIGFLSRYTNRRTRANYELDLRQYRNFLTTRAHVPHMLAATRTDVNMWLLSMHDADLAEATVARRFGTVRCFYKYAVIDELIPKDPTVHIETPKIDHDAQRRTWLTTLQFAQLLKFSRRNDRSHAMVVSMGMLGMRIAEMCSLDVTDVRRLIGAANVTFTGKGGRTFTLDLPLEVLTAYDNLTAGRTVGPLFLTRDGLARWTPSDARRHLATLVRHADLGDVDITPHGLRRTAARTLQERGVELGAIQQFLRHADPRTTSTCYVGKGGGAASLARATLASIYGQMSA